MCGYIGKFSKKPIDYKHMDVCNELQICRGPDEKKLVNDLHKQYPNKTELTIMIVSHGGFLGRSLPRKLYKKSVNSHKINNTAIWKLQYNFNTQNNELNKTKEWAEELYDGGKKADYNQYNKQFEFCSFD